MILPTRRCFRLIAAALLAGVVGAAAVGVPALSAADDAGVDVSAAEAAEADAARWNALSDALGRAGTINGRVYTVTVPRDDLDVTTEAGPVPVDAGLASVFHFYRCDCGKMNVVGQFCLLDFEANDVIDELRNGMVKVVSVNPMFLGERPRLTALRFQGEGGSDALAATLKAALEWTGEARNAPATRPATPAR